MKSFQFSLYLPHKPVFALQFFPAAAAAKSLQLCPTLCDPRDGSPPGSPVHGILQARTLEWVAISFSKAWKWKVKVKMLSRVQLLAIPWTAAHKAPPSVGFSKQEYWSGVPLPSPFFCYIFNNPSIPLIYIFFSSVTQSSSALWPHGLPHARLPCRSPTPRVYSNSCPLSRWCHPTISSSVIPFSSCLQSIPASGSFPMSPFFTSGGRSIGVQASASVLPMNIQDWFSLG